MDNRCLVADPIRDSGVIEVTAVALLQESLPHVCAMTGAIRNLGSVPIHNSSS
jgi:hypothetical protein